MNNRWRLLPAKFNGIRLRVNQLVVDKAACPRRVAIHFPKSVTVSQNLVEQVAESYEAMVGDYLDRLDVWESARTWDRWCTAFDSGDLLYTLNYLFAVQRFKGRKMRKEVRIIGALSMSGVRGVSARIVIGEKRVRNELRIGFDDFPVKLVLPVAPSLGIECS